MSRLFAALILATAGMVLFGQGIYIHAKAMLAQVLLKRASRPGTRSSRGLGPIPGRTRASP
jgi:sortase A